MASAGQSRRLGSRSAGRVLYAATSSLVPGSLALSLLCWHPPPHWPPSPLPTSRRPWGGWGQSFWGQESGLCSFQGTLGSLSALPYI